MVILHVAYIDDSLYTGVGVVVPQHIKAQKEYAEVALINVKGIDIPGTDLLALGGDVKFDELPYPFSKPDLVVFHEVYRFRYIKIYRELLKRNIPYVVVPHGCLTEEAQHKHYIKKLVGNALLFNRFVNKALAVQYLSEFEKIHSKKYRNMFIGTNGISIPEQFKTCFRNHGMKIVFIGRLESFVKGLDLMVDAIRIKRELLHSLDAEIHIYGPDYNGRFDALKSMIEDAECNDLIELHHEITGQEKIDVLMDSDLFIQTSRHEGMPMGILEALSYGIPCLLTKGTTLGPEVQVNGAGWCADNNAESIASILEEALLSTDKYMKMGENARQFVIDNYAWEKIAFNIIEEYGSLLS